MRRGITLIELLLALSIAALVMAAAGAAYIQGAGAQQALAKGRDAVARRAAFEAALNDLFSHAYLDSDATDQGTYFISGDALAGKSVNSDSTVGQDSSASQGSIAFTTLGRRLPSSLLSSQDDFETNNQNFGPVGGVTEVQLGTTAVGTDPNSDQGLFLREQAPSDSDPTQGGQESLLSSDVETIQFEFYDGTQWLTTWDTTTMGTRRLPSAVRVTYKLRDEDDQRTLILALPASDVTPDNPVQDVSA